MALKSKPGTFLERQLNERNVSKHRALVLKINYLKGLAFEYEKKYDQFIEKETALLEQYYQQDVKPLEAALEGQSKNDIKREKAIAKVLDKSYWLRRKFKTSMLKKNDEDTVLTLLEAFDEDTKIRNAKNIEVLNQKFPSITLSGEEKTKIEQQIANLKTQKENDLAKMNQKGEALKVKVAKFLEKNQKKIDHLEFKNDKLTEKIISYNKTRQAEDKVLLDRFESQLLGLKAEQAKGNLVPEKNIIKLENTVNKIKTVKNVLENDDIHLSISNLKMYFGGVKAVNDLTFDVKRGEIFGLIGPNGAGKTTVFNCITQFYKATGGNMILRNKENHVVDLYDFKTHDMIKEGIARSFQNVELIWELTVLDNLMVAAHSLLITSFFDHMAHTPKLLREDQVIRTKGYQILKNLGIEDYAFRSPYGLPYGVLKKIELARTLMTDPSLIILDEPAAGLNDAETEDLAKVIKKINEEYSVTIFLVEHDMGLVMSICDRICAISFGKRIGLGTPKEIQNNPEVRKAYLGDDDDE